MSEKFPCEFWCKSLLAVSDLQMETSNNGSHRCTSNKNLPDRHESLLRDFISILPAEVQETLSETCDVLKSIIEEFWKTEIEHLSTITPTTGRDSLVIPSEWAQLKKWIKRCPSTRKITTDVQMTTRRISKLYQLLPDLHLHLKQRKE